MGAVIMNVFNLDRQRSYCIEVERDDISNRLVVQRQLVYLDEVVLNFILQHSKYYNPFIN